MGIPVCLYVEVAGFELYATWEMHGFKKKTLLISYYIWHGEESKSGISLCYKGKNKGKQIALVYIIAALNILFIPCHL